jgi:hypothetical protein
MAQPDRPKKLILPTDFYEHEKHITSVSRYHNRILQLGSVGLVAGGVGAIAYGITQRDPIGFIGALAGAGGVALFNEAAKDIRRDEEWLKHVESRPAIFVPTED